MAFVVCCGGGYYRAPRGLALEEKKYCFDYGSLVD